MVALFDDVSGSLRRPRSYRSAPKTTRSAWRTGLDLVGRAHEFHKSAKGKGPPGNPEPGDRKTEILGGGWLSPRPQQTPAFNDLPNNQARNTEAELPQSRNQRKSKGRVPGNPEQTANENIAAFLNANATGDSKGGCADGESHALQNERVDKGCRKIHGIQRDPGLARREKKRSNCPGAASEKAAATAIQCAHGAIQSVALLHQRLPIGGTGETRNQTPDKSEHSPPLGEKEPAKSKKSNHHSEQGWTNETCLSRYLNKKHQAKEGKSGLHKYTQRKIDNHRPGRDWE